MRDARQIPGVKICAAHAAATCRRTWAAPTRSASGSLSLQQEETAVEEYFKTQIMVDSMVFREEGLRHLVAEVGAGQMVYGTDMPFGWPANRISS
jgi:aminocarboxymuconate-semialdehyde decarboxylase